MFASCLNVWLIMWYEYVFEMLYEWMVLFYDGCTNALCAKIVDMYLSVSVLVVVLWFSLLVDYGMVVSLGKRLISINRHDFLILGTYGWHV